MNRTLGRMLLLSAVAVIFAGIAHADDKETPAKRAVEMWKKMNEPIDYELLVQTTVDKTLNELLSRQGIPWKVSPRAVAKGSLTLDAIKSAEIDKINVLRGVPRRSVLVLLLQNVRVGKDEGPAVGVVRPDGVEITTQKAYLDEFFPGRTDANLPPLVYAVFENVPLQDALKELGQATDSDVTLDDGLGEAAKAKVSAELTAVPLDKAVEKLADKAGLKLVRLGNVYYVTTPKRARLLRKEEQERRLEQEKGKTDSTKPPANP